MSVYISNTVLEMRRAECARIQARHPEMIPVVVEASGKHSKVSFTALSPMITVQELEGIAREVANAPNNKAVRLTIAGCSPAPATVLADLYEHCKAEDGFLYVNFASEKAMGAVLASPCYSGVFS